MHKPCPFCGKPFDPQSHDTIYPSGLFWRVIDGTEITGEKEFIEIVHFKEHNPETDHPFYTFHCPSNEGGCGAEVSGYSREEAIKKWNTRYEPKL